MTFSKHLELIAQEALHKLGAKPISQYHLEQSKQGLGSYFTFQRQPAPNEIWCAFPTQFVKRLVKEGATPEVPVIIHIQTLKECTKTPSGNMRIGTRQKVSRLSYYRADGNNAWRHFRETGPREDEPFFLEAENIFYSKAPEQLTATFSKDKNIPFHWTSGLRHKGQYSQRSGHYS